MSVAGTPRSPSATAPAAATERLALLGQAAAWSVVSAIPSIVAVSRSNSPSMLGASLRANLEGLATVVVWLALRRVARRGESEENFGPGKLHGLVSLGLAGALAASFAVVVAVAAVRIAHPAAPRGAWWGLAVWGGFYLPMNLWFWRRAWRLARGGDSVVVEGVWRLFRLKALATLVVLVATGAAVLAPEARWLPRVDPVGALLVAGLIAHSAWRVGSRSIDELLDRALGERDQLRVLRRLAERIDDYDALHRVRSRRAGDTIFLEIDIEFPDDLPMGEAKRRILAMKDAIRVDFPGAEITFDPAPEAARDA